MNWFRFATILLLTLTLGQDLTAQIGLPKGRDLIKKKSDGSMTLNTDSDLGSIFATKLSKNRSEYEEAGFNYAIAFSDNAGLFETRQRFDKQKNTLMDGLRMTSAKSTESKVRWTKSDHARHANSTGEMLYASNKFKSAEAAFENALRWYEEDHNKVSDNYALVLNNLGLLYHTTGRFNLSERFTKEALVLRERVAKNTSAHAASLNNQGVLFKDLGRYNESEQLLDQALSMNERVDGKNTIPYALTLNNKAMLYQSIGRYSQAEELMLEAVSIAKEHLKEKSNNYNKLMINLALLYRDMEKLTEAEGVYLEAIELKEKKLGKRHPDYAHLQRGLASLYVQMNKPVQVEGLLQSAAEIYKKQFGEKHPSYAATLTDLGNWNRVNDNLVEAEPQLIEARDIRKEILGVDHPDYIKSVEDLALVHWQQGKTDQAEAEYLEAMTASMTFVDRYFAPMSEAEKAKYWAKLQPRLQRFYNFATQRSAERPNLVTTMFEYQIKTKALLLNASNKIRTSIMNSGDQALIDKYVSWLDKKEELARLYTLSHAEREEEGVDLAAIEREANQLEKELSSESADFGSGYGSKQAVTFNDVKNGLAPDEALVDIIQFHEYNKSFTDQIWYVALITDKSKSQPSLVLFKNGVDLEGVHLNTYRNAIYDLATEKDSYQAYWAPIAAQLNNPKRVFVSPDGAYNLVSLATLQGPDGSYLIDAHETVIISNAREAIELKQPAGLTHHRTATLFGYPSYGDLGKVSMLPGTKTEVENINEILTEGGYKTTMYLEGEASEDNLKVAHTGILHIATHGFFLPDVSRVKREKLLGIETRALQDNPLHRSGLLLANAEATMYGSGGDHSSSNNGILTAYEAMNLNLDGTELVVMSACETGLGDVKSGEGVYGLQRSFRVAGADAIIMSLWQVSDEATMELMTTFYINMADGSDKRTAFLDARKAVKKKYPQPFFWGAFVLVGE